MLEEIKFDYKITEINLSQGEQFNSTFRKISPFSKIPAITDHKNKVSLFQSGAILIYLAELSGKFYDTDNKNVINEWLMAQMGDIGPMLGQHHQFHHYNPGKSKFGEERYFDIAKRLYKDLDEGRRETWDETVERYFDFFTGHLKETCEYDLTNGERVELEEAVKDLKVMPSMRC